MEKIVFDPRSISLSIRLYNVLLQIYPSTFQEEYGWLMAQVFGDCCRKAVREQGVYGLIPLWALTMLDTLATAVEEHMQRGTDMSQEKFARLSGWAFILSGVTFIVGWLASSRPEYDPRNYYSLGIDRIANAVTAPLILSSLLLISLGMLGLLVRFGRSSSMYGYLSLLVGVVSGLITAGGWLLIDILGLQFFGNDAGWYIFLYGMGLMFTGLAAWGVDCLRKRFLSRGNGLALLAGIWFPLFIMISGIYEAITGNWFDLLGFDIVLFVLTTAGLVGLGIQMLSGLRQNPSPAAT